MFLNLHLKTVLIKLFNGIQHRNKSETILKTIKALFFPQI